MPFDWKQFLELAHDLEHQSAGSPHAETLLRSSLSRAYYAAFCYARNYSRDWLGFQPRNDADDHGRLREHLKRSRRRGIADRLQRLREWRNESDYLDQLTFDPTAVVAAALGEANHVFAGLTPPASTTP